MRATVIKIHGDPVLGRKMAAQMVRKDIELAEARLGVRQIRENAYYAALKAQADRLYTQKRKPFLGGKLTQVYVCLLMGLGVIRDEG